MLKKHSTEEQIDDLAKQLLDITKQLNTLKVQLRREREEATKRTSEAQDSTHNLQIGDRVIVLNNYQDLQGTEGTVIRLSTTFVTLRTDTGREITRGNHNVRRI